MAVLGSGIEQINDWVCHFLQRFLRQSWTEHLTMDSDLHVIKKMLLASVRIQGLMPEHFIG